MFSSHLLPSPLFFLDNQTSILLYYIPLTASTSPRLLRSHVHPSLCMVRSNDAERACASHLERAQKTAEFPMRADGRSGGSSCVRDACVCACVRACVRVCVAHACARWRGCVRWRVRMRARWRASALVCVRPCVHCVRLRVLACIPRYVAAVKMPKTLATPSVKSGRKCENA